MIDPGHIRYAERAVEAASSGSPAIVEAIGRLYGLAQAERDALSKGAVPGWLLAAVGLGVGVAIGARLHKAWPQKMKWIAGG
jgi:hypothetical protein